MNMPETMSTLESITQKIKFEDLKENKQNQHHPIQEMKSSISEAPLSESL
jgi:hypothetical protein